jgi:hypothetical protein
MLSWHEIKLLTGLKIPKLYPHSWASDILLNEVCSERERSLFIIGMYSLWMQRNNRRHGENQLPVRHAVQWVVDLAHDLWQIAQSKKQLRPVSIHSAWQPPPEGWFKRNADGAFYMGTNQGATGAVLRTPSGSFVAGRACWYSHGLDTLMLERLACRDGVKLA